MEETQKFSVQELIDNIYQIKKRMQEVEVMPQQYCVQIRPDIAKMIEELARAKGITWEEAWFGLLNGEF